MKLPINLVEHNVEFVGAVPAVDTSAEGPHVHFDWDEPYDFPDVGTMTVKFRVNRRSEEMEKDGTKRYRVCIELLQLQKIKKLEAPSNPSNSHEEAGEAMDKLRDEMGY